MIPTRYSTLDDEKLFEELSQSRNMKNHRFLAIFKECLERLFPYEGEYDDEIEGSYVLVSGVTFLGHSRIDRTVELT